jgi:hypothetical protein
MSEPDIHTVFPASERERLREQGVDEGSAEEITVTAPFTGEVIGTVPSTGQGPSRRPSSVATPSRRRRPTPPAAPPRG